MSMDKNELREIYLNYNNDKLIEIAYLENDKYNEEAIEVIKGILKERGIRKPPEEIVRKLAEKTNREKEEPAAELTGLVQVYSAGEVLEAGMIKGILEGDGIQVFIKDQYLIGTMPFYSTALGGVKITVLKKDEKRAREILSDYHGPPKNTGGGQEEDESVEKAELTENGEETAAGSGKSPESAGSVSIMDDSDEVIKDDNRFLRSVLKVFKFTAVIAVFYYIIMKIMGRKQ